MKLFPHQEEALNLTEGFQNIAVYHDMGLGKTFTGSEMMKRFGCRNNLIICQKSKIDDWFNHFCTNYSDQGYSFLNLTNKGELEYFMEDTPLLKKVGIINYELAWRRKELLKLTDFCLMLDESSLIQNSKAKQSKFILKLKPDHVILLSGTPTGGKYENLWTQVHLLGWGIKEDLFLRRYVNWRKIEVGGLIRKIVDKSDPYKNIDSLKDRMREYGAIFKKTEECYQLPKQIFTKVFVKPSCEYWTFKRDSIVSVDSVELVGDTTLTKMLYQRQLCGQYNPHKIDALRDLLESTNDRVIVFYNFDCELYKIKELCAALNRPVSEVNGHNKDLTAYEDETNSVTLCQYRSASKGLNLQKCNRIVYFTLPLGSEDFEQSKKRIHRIGQEHSCFYYLMLSTGTIEESILSTLEQRKDYTDELFRKENET